MSWILEGKNVAGKYMEQSFEGMVVESRVKFGGKVQHTVELDHPIQLRWRKEPTTRILVDSAELD